MGRLWSSGFELNDTGSNDWTTVAPNTLVTTTTVRSGAYSGELSNFSSNTSYYFQKQFQGADANGPFYARAYIYITAYPTSNPIIMSFHSAVGSFASSRLFVRMSSTGVLDLQQSGGASLGTSSALALNQWYRLELLFNNSGGAGAGVADLRIDGVSAVSSTTATLGAGVDFFTIGRNSVASTVGSYFFDDAAINDSSGSAQTSWPGDGKIVHLRPSAPGDNAGWTRGGSDTGANWSQASEVTPDGVVTYLTRTSGQPIDDHNVASSASAGIGSSDTVTLVALGTQIGAISTTQSAARQLTLRIKSASGGSVLTQADVDCAINGFLAHERNAPRNYQLTAYTDPTTTLAWTPTGTNSLDNMQIGIQPDTSSTTEVRYSTLWALVEYVPAVTPPAATFGTNLMMMGV